MAKAKNVITIRGAKVHNLKNVSLDIPKNKLVVITGISGSGKSSLAFDTLYAEGQRRYVESLSAYARQFLGMMDKPDVDSIEGLSPAISIDQKNISKNPRSTVGTTTEIHDYLRLLFARTGTPHCPECGKVVERQSPTQITEQLLALPKGTRILICAPVVADKKGEHKGVIDRLATLGYPRLRVNGENMLVEEAEELSLERYKRHTIEVVVDRVAIDPDNADERTRLAESIEQALRLGDGVAVVSFAEGKRDDLIFSESLACLHCGVNLPEIEPRMFSFNSPHGACTHCTGLGYTNEVDPSRIISNPRLTIAEGAIHPWATASHRIGRQGWFLKILRELSDELSFSLNIPVKDLPKKVVETIIHGSKDPEFEGVIPNLTRRYHETSSEHTRKEIGKYMVEQTCPACEGKRLRPAALSVRLGDITIDWVSEQTIDDCADFFNAFFKNVSLSSAHKNIAKPIVKEIAHRLTFLRDVGLNYLTLNRSATTLSGGEAQRIRLATQIGSGLAGVLYVLDEPSIGLHQRDQKRLITTLKKLRDIGNSVVVVEHDEQTINEADWVIDVGPGAGAHGGKILFEGTPAQLKRSKTLTGKYLSGKETVAITPSAQKKLDKAAEKNKEENNKELTITGAAEHNLKAIDVQIPLGSFVCVTGVSGSGKSTLVNDILARSLRAHFFDSTATPGAHKSITGIEHIDSAVVVDQSPIGRTPRSNPATYTGVFTPVRELFSKTREAQVRGYKPGRFSFNVKGGRCEACEGQGLKKIEMHFLPDLYVECEECHGTRYNREALEILYKGKNIAEVLSLSTEEAYEFFKHVPAIARRLKTMCDVGLGYIELGQPATTLSGGEAQRVKLSTELSKRSANHTLYILDEPTTGLHFADISRLLAVLHRLKAKGNTVLVIEHNIDVIRTADWIVDLGPEGGAAGGEVVAIGTPTQIAKKKKSHTGTFLQGRV